MSAVRLRRLLATLCATVVLLPGCIGGSSGGIDAAIPRERDPLELLPEATTPPLTAEAEQAAMTPTALALGDGEIALDCLGVRQRVGQLLLPLANQAQLGTALPIATAGELGGIGLLEFPDERLADQLAELQQASFVPITVASDEEGGTVQRLTNLLGPIPAAATNASTKSEDQVRSEWRDYGLRAKALGIDVILGPVIDVGAGPGIGSRSFSADPAIVAAYGRATADGLREAGVTPVFKHFPGHGRASGDSHLGLPLAPSLEELRGLDLVPWVELVGSGAGDDAGVMIAHLSVPGLSGDLPTSLSPETIEGLLKNEIGFSGLVYTDAVNMGAIVDGYGTLEAVELALRAGSDVVILGRVADHAPVTDHLTAVAERDPGFAALIDERARRVLASKGQAELCVGAR